MENNNAWSQYQGDFNAMTDEQIEKEVSKAQNEIDSAESWLEAVAAWKKAGKPRSNITE